MGLGAPFSGGLIDKFGAGRIVVICVLAAIGGLYLMYAATSANDLLISGVLLGIGVSGTGVTSLVGTIGRLAPPEKRLSRDCLDRHGRRHRRLRVAAGDALPDRSWSAGSRAFCG